MTDELISRDATRQRVLVVEDHPATAEFMRVILRSSYSVDIAHTPETARRILMEHDIDAVCMDISLGSTVTGLDLTREIRTMPRYASIPIIAVTAHSLDREREACIEAGCNDVFVKPFQIDALLFALEGLLAARRRSV